jgi:hypothetical protein
MSYAFAASLRRRLTQPGTDEALVFEGIQRCVGGADRHRAAGLLLDLE